MTKVKMNANGTTSAVCQSARITKAGARPANRKAVAMPTIWSIRGLFHLAPDPGAVPNLLAGTLFPAE